MLIKHIKGGHFLLLSVVYFLRDSLTLHFDFHNYTMDDYYSLYDWRIRKI